MFACWLICSSRACTSTSVWSLQTSVLKMPCLTPNWSKCATIESLVSCECSISCPSAARWPLSCEMSAPNSESRCGSRQGAEARPLDSTSSSCLVPCSLVFSRREAACTWEISDWLVSTSSTLRELKQTSKLAGSLPDAAAPATTSVPPEIRTRIRAVRTRNSWMLASSNCGSVQGSSDAESFRSAATEAPKAAAPLISLPPLPSRRKQRSCGANVMSTSNLWRSSTCRVKWSKTATTRSERWLKAPPQSRGCSLAKPSGAQSPSSSPDKSVLRNGRRCMTSSLENFAFCMAEADVEAGGCGAKRARTGAVVALEHALNLLPVASPAGTNGASAIAAAAEPKLSAATLALPPVAVDSVTAATARRTASVSSASRAAGRPTNAMRSKHSFLPEASSASRCAATQPMLRLASSLALRSGEPIKCPSNCKPPAAAPVNATTTPSCCNPCHSNLAATMCKVSVSVSFRRPVKPPSCWQKCNKAAPRLRSIMLWRQSCAEALTFWCSSLASFAVAAEIADAALPPTGLAPSDSASEVARQSRARRAPKSPASRSPCLASSALSCFSNSRTTEHKSKRF
mmetsp:Transcript_101236/g.325300  ORF Transcript_101236/g.325300 Transcript_101236/m.325300 type:complete len:573 (-) Transcript_101236:720-2438(-)